MSSLFYFPMAFCTGKYFDHHSGSCNKGFTSQSKFFRQPGGRNGKNQGRGIRRG